MRHPAICEDHLPYYKDSSCSLPLLLSMMSSNNRGDKKISLWWMLSMELTMHNSHVSMPNAITSQSRDPTSLAQKGATEFYLLDSTTPRLARTSAGAPGIQGPLEWGSWGFNAARGRCSGQLRSNKMTRASHLWTK